MVYGFMDVYLWIFMVDISDIIRSIANVILSGL